LRLGANVVGADLPEGGAENADRVVSDSEGRYVPVTGDISRVGDVAGIVRRAIDVWGALHILVNAAAMTGASLDDDGDVVTTPLELWDRIIEVNLRGTMLMCRQAIPEILSSGGGAIINVSSHNAEAMVPSVCAYSASKAGVNSLTRSIAAAFGRKGIRCNAVMPGLVLGTKASSTYAPLTPEVLAERESQTLVGRLGRPADIAAMVTFLASDEEAGYVNGQVIRCDGGAVH
jgi:NAD(P)-dependent dehydrogenase (short-subunit alcohol dehydrogenase family)